MNDPFWTSENIEKIKETDRARVRTTHRSSVIGLLIAIFIMALIFRSERTQQELLVQILKEQISQHTAMQVNNELVIKLLKTQHN